MKAFYKKGGEPMIVPDSLAKSFSEITLEALILLRRRKQCKSLYANAGLRCGIYA